MVCYEKKMPQFKKQQLTILFLTTFWTKFDCWEHCSLQQCMNKMKVIKTKWENVPDLTNDEKKLCPQKKHGIFELVQLSAHETTTEIFRGSHAVLFLWEVGKVYIFWEGHKVLRNLHRRFDLYYIGQIYSGDLAKFSGLLRIYEL